jgi:hypothetical protein
MGAEFAYFLKDSGKRNLYRFTDAMMTRARAYCFFFGIAAVVLGGFGCTTSSPETKQKAEQKLNEERARAAQAVKSSIMRGEQRQISIQELDQLTYGFADRYYMVIGSAVDAIKRGNDNPIERRRAHQIKLNGVLSINDIVSGNDPYAQIFDLVVAVTLESIVLIDENGAEHAFGKRAPGLIKAIRTMRIEVWELASKVLNQEQLELLDYIILEWRRTHREVEQVAFVRFDNFSGARGAKLLSDLKAGTGFLAPLSEASQVLRDWGRLTERAFWYSKRAPNVAAIQAEGAVNEILSAPEISSMIQTADRLGQTAQSVPQTIDAQRKAIFADLDARQMLLTNTLGDVRLIVTEANSLGGSLSILATNMQNTLAVLGETLKTADVVGQRFGFDKPSTNAPGRPFDVREYTAALGRLNEVITNVQGLTLRADEVPRTEGWKKGMQDVSELTDRRVDRVFSRLCMAIGLAFVLAIVYRAIVVKMIRPAELKPSSAS